MVNKDMSIGFWSHVLQDSKAVARQVLNKITNKPQGKKTFYVLHACLSSGPRYMT